MVPQMMLLIVNCGGYWLVSYISPFDQARDITQSTRSSKRVFQVFGCVVTCEDMVAHKDHTQAFNKVRKSVYKY